MLVLLILSSIQKIINEMKYEFRVEKLTFNLILWKTSPISLSNNFGKRLFFWGFSCMKYFMHTQPRGRYPIKNRSIYLTKYLYIVYIYSECAWFDLFISWAPWRYAQCRFIISKGGGRVPSWAPKDPRLAVPRAPNCHAATALNSLFHKHMQPSLLGKAFDLCDHFHQNKKKIK